MGIAVLSADYLTQEVFHLLQGPRRRSQSSPRKRGLDEPAMPLAPPVLVWALGIAHVLIDTMMFEATAELALEFWPAVGHDGLRKPERPHPGAQKTRPDLGGCRRLQDRAGLKVAPVINDVEDRPRRA